MRTNSRKSSSGRYCAQETQSNTGSMCKANALSDRSPGRRATHSIRTHIIRRSACGTGTSESRRLIPNAGAHAHRIRIRFSAGSPREKAARDPKPVFTALLRSKRRKTPGRCMQSAARSPERKRVIPPLNFRTGPSCRYGMNVPHRSGRDESDSFRPLFSPPVAKKCYICID